MGAIEFDGPNPFAWAIISIFGALIFALGGALMRPHGDKKWSDVRLLPRFYRVVFAWMLRGAVVLGVWGAILGAVLLVKRGDAISGALLGLIFGTICGEIVGLLIGAARGALHREREA